MGAFGGLKVLEKPKDNLVKRRSRDRKYRRYGSMKAGVQINAWVSKEAKEKLEALRDDGETRISIGAVIEKLAIHATKLPSDQH